MALKLSVTLDEIRKMSVSRKHTFTLQTGETVTVDMSGDSRAVSAAVLAEQVPSRRRIPSLRKGINETVDYP